jgi:hypothetical protein
MTPEGKVKKEIKEHLDSIGAYYFMPVQMGYGVWGTPDFLVCHHGLFVGIEAKAPGKDADKFQLMVMQRIREAKGQAFVARSAQDVFDYFDRHRVSV